jgi:predicted TIM-barrel fold metal-dependent hydrolase
MNASTPLAYDNIIDADGHILEPPDLWENYIDPRFRERAIRVRPGDDGVEQLQFDGRPSRFFNLGVYSLLASMGRDADEIAEAMKRPYHEAPPFGAMDPAERVALLDKEGLRAAVLYPSIGLTWECEIEDPQLADSYTRAYNRWIVDFCSESGERLIPIAHISLGDGASAAAELERAVKAGCKGGFVAPFTITNKAHAHKDYDRFWDKAQELDVPIAIHPMAEHPAKRVYQRFDRMKWADWYHNVLGGQGPQQAFYCLFQYGLFDRFPELKIVVLESGAGWVGASLDRMDATFGTALGETVPLKEKPSFYFKRQCWISADPDETALPLIIEHIGNDRFFWATDYPHFDHPGNYLEALANLVAPLSDPARNNILGDSVAKVYDIS